ncbi:MAG: cysteine--tRNA ligase, partial [Planctomycetes bacterium]|nr:cysteine--tRNA ligase [Planctomycetota bacterium]
PLGIVLEDRAGGTEWSGGADDTLEGIMQLLLELRQTARANKDFSTSDTIRDRLAENSVTLEDRPGGTEWSQG